MSTIRTCLCFLFFLLGFCVSTFAQHPQHVPGEILVKLRPGLSATQWLDNHSDWRDAGIFLKPGRQNSAPMNVHTIHFDPAQMDEEVLLEMVRQDAHVDIAQFNHYVQLRSTIPNDPEYAQQWQYENTGQSGGTIGADMDMDLAWDYTTGGLSAMGDTIVVCVIDDGVSATHPDMVPNLWVNHAEIPNNGIDDDNNGFIDDYRGWDTGSSSDSVFDGGIHGTPVAGIVGARGDNGIGVAGVNWQVKLMIVQGGTGVESEVLEAYSYPLVMRQKYNQTNGAEGAFVVATNASWGLDMGQASSAPLWCAFYDTLGVYGILNAGATANAALDVDTQGDLPTSCPSNYLIGVTNVDHNDQKVTQAAWGVTHVDLGAFGEGTHTVDGFGGYAGFGGTSGATPHVAGAIALLYAAPCPSLIGLVQSDPGAAALLVRQAILDGVDPNASLNGITATGGRLNVHNSMLLLLQSCGPCPAPRILDETNVTDGMATLNWNAGDSTLNTDLQWRAVGDTVWNVVPGLDSSFVLTGLTPCTFYEYQLTSNCPNDTSDFASTKTFKTDGCCENPSDFAVVSFGEDSARMSWSGILAAQSYQVRIREEGTFWTTSATTDTSFLFENLAPCTNYQVQISVVCADDTVAFGRERSFRTLGCGSCIDLPYCSPPQLNSEEEWIDSVQIHTLINASGDNNGYGDFTTSMLSTDLTIGDTNLFSLSPGFFATPYDEYFGIWIDYNQDGDFEDADEEVYTSGFTTTSVNGSFIVPEHALPGNTRMRVFMQFDDIPAPCIATSDPFGEVEDYCVNILPVVIPCIAPTGLDTLALSNTAILLGWEADTNVTDYLLRYRSMNDSSWTEKTTEADSFLLDKLDFCQSYEVQIKSICGETESEFGAVDTFSTLCRTAIGSKFPEGSLKAYPNPFSDQIIVQFRSQDQSSSLVLDLFNAQGMQVIRQEFRALPEESREIQLNTGELVPGMYWIRIRNEAGTFATLPILKRRND
ncbi:MAG: S8 family serine peptidase [Bacteroidota bacterium]